MNAIANAISANRGPRQLVVANNLRSIATPANITELKDMQAAAGLNWRAQEAPVLFNTGTAESFDIRTFSDRKVLYRNDTRMPLGVVGSKYRPVQPDDVVNFYDDLTARHGFTIETMGQMRGGRFIWALAKTGISERVMGQDEIAAYLLLYTSYDSSCATVARFTSFRFACENMLHMVASETKPYISIRHDSIFNPDKVKLQLGVGDAFERYMQDVMRMANREVTPAQTADFFMQVYHGMKVAELKATDEKRADKTMERMMEIVTSAPGQNLRSAQGTAFGLLNAVTYDIDHNTRARSEEGAVLSAMVGAGERTKRRALDLALALAA